MHKIQTEFSLQESVKPLVEPLALDDIKAHINLRDFTDDDVYIPLLIKKSRIYFENLTRRSLINTTWVQRMDEFPEIIRLGRSPAGSVTSITYIDENGDPKALAGAKFQTDLFSEPARIAPVDTEIFPTTQPNTFNTVSVTFVAGYGAAASDVPDDILGTLRGLVAHWYQHREPTVTGTIISKVPFWLDSLIMLQRVLEVA